MRPKSVEKENAIRLTALQIIAESGLENLSIQKLAKTARISPRTLYLKYLDKEDFLIKLFIDEVLATYEKAVLEDFHETLDFEPGVKKIWLNTFHYLKSNRPHYALMQYGKSSPLLNKAFQELEKKGQFFSPIHRFLTRHVEKGRIRDFPREVHRALLLSPLLDIVGEYFNYNDRRSQIITDELVLQCCDAVMKGMKK